MAYRLDKTITRDFTLHNPATGQVQDADVLPTCQVFEDITDIPIITPAVVKRVGEIGNYKTTFTLSTVNGFKENKSYNVIVEATVAGKTAKSRIASFDIDTAEAPVRPKAHFTV